jgi:cyanophycin synthetase
MPAAAARIVELRVLDGPNLYFPRPAIKLTLAAEGWLRAPAARVAAAAGRLGVDATRPGPAGSEQRRRVVARVAKRATGLLAAAAGTRLAVRSRAGAEPEEIVVAFPWRRRGSAEALGEEVGSAMAALLTRSPDRVVAAAARRLASVDPGDPPSVPDPLVPVIQVTGTNGKTTTTRLLAHIGRVAGRRVAYSSTDGVFADGAIVKEGDYSGFGGAATALAQQPDLAVLETARGGILLRGIGVLHNDVAVVTNVSEDHLDLHGIRTLDQLAEVKATITRITRPEGWVVLNADDPRVLAMRRGATGRPWLFSLDPDHPAIRDVLGGGGRATVPLDGRITVLDGTDAMTLARLIDVPVTLAGISSVYVQNTLAAASAALAVRLPPRAVARGLRTFVMDPEANPGRANLFRLNGRVVVLDYAHNEAGMNGLTEICRGLRPPGGEVWLAFGTAGDRTDRILHAFAAAAARGADHVAIAELLRYLRGRDRHELVARLRAGAEEGGAAEVPVFQDELTALREMLSSSRAGDVVAVTALAQRPELFAYLRRRRAERLGPPQVRALVRTSRRRAS